MSGRQHGGPRITGVIRIFPCVVAYEVLSPRPCFGGCHPFRVPSKWTRRPCPLCPAGSVGRAVYILRVMVATRTGCHWMPRRSVAKEGKPTLATISPSRQAAALLMAVFHTAIRSACGSWLPPVPGAIQTGTSQGPLRSYP